MVSERKSKPRVPWFAAGIRFECQRCGKCCRGEPGFVWVTRVEIERMAGHLNMPRETFARKYVRREGTRLSLKERANGDCVLWDKRCTVYECRPVQCRTFPFWKHALKSRAAFRQTSQSCPGIGKGRLYTCEEILAIAAGQRDT